MRQPMDQDLKHALSHILWIGGATDSGKSTVARQIAGRYRLSAYHYDELDRAHHERLAETMPVHRQMLAASLDERWVHPEPHDLLQRVLRSFQDRHPLVIEDLLTMPGERAIVAEGFGLLPELIAPLLSSEHQAIWLVSTAPFKQASMARRGKPSFGARVRDPVRARHNVFTRDMLLADLINEQAGRLGLPVVKIDGSRTAEQITVAVEHHFRAFLPDPTRCPKGDTEKDDEQ